MRERLSRPITVLVGVVATVLLIACVNLANLMLARVTDRAYEFGIRTALGAGRWQTLQKVLIESVYWARKRAGYSSQLKHDSANPGDERDHEDVHHASQIGDV